MKRVNTGIDRIIKLNSFRKRAIAEKDYKKFEKFTLRLHQIEAADGVAIGSYIY